LTFSSLNDIIKSTHAIDAKGGRLPIGKPGRLRVGMHGRLRRYPHPSDVPEHFTLVFNADKVRIPCHTIWRKENWIGVAFD
jgi:hypothetical protein